jgi:two-component system, OmpR family, sensor histidine kinase KdpD
MSSDEVRPDPDALLQAIKRQEAPSSRGRLKVFLGMSAGVGKTYAMLEAGHKALKDGRDVVIGYVESHGRAETDALTQGLPAVARRGAEHRGVTLTEMDLDAVLARRPQLALVDELAHTNAPGSRHPKRWQDVQELLDAGVDVYTTLNIQHVESRTENVRHITGSTIYETVPDSVLDGAEIELIDLPPEELLQRMQSGKVYSGERAETALFNFFREGNLSALREIALRYAAGRVSRDVQDYLQTMQIDGPWKTGDRLLVAVSGSPTSSSLIRWTRRLSEALSADWIAVHVQPARGGEGSASQQLTRNLALARELGAEVVTTSDQDPVRGVLRVARQRNVTQIVAGKPSGGMLQSIGGALRLNRLLADSGSIDVHFVRADGPRKDVAEHGRFTARASTPGKRYALALGAVVAMTLINALLSPVIGYRSVALTYLAAVMALAFFLERGPIIAAAAASALLWNFFFLPPILTFYISTLEDGLMFGMYFVAAVVLGQLVARIRAQELGNAQREERATALYLLTRDLADAPDFDAAAGVLVRRVAEAFRSPAALSLVKAEGLSLQPPHPAGLQSLDEKEAGVAAWAAQHGAPAGRFTDNLPSARLYHLPVRAGNRPLGVLSIDWAGESAPTFEQREQLDAYARQGALVLDRLRLGEAAAEARLTAESERLGKTLLNSISHELRTPLSAIATASSGLAAAGPLTTDQQRLTGEIEEATTRLNRLVRNLLDVARLESGHLKPVCDWCDPRDVCQVAVDAVGPLYGRHKLTTSIPTGLPLVRADFVLLEQALVNLLANAAIHTPPGTAVEFAAEERDGRLVLRVSDRGPGVPEEELPKLFEKFHRGTASAPGGTGLGLSIARGFVEAQGGQLTAAVRPGGGLEFTIRLPLENAPTLPAEAE